MPRTLSPDGYTTFRDELPYDPARIARAAVWNGVAIPAVAAAQLEARGINVGELEQRIRDTMECRR
jgi:hypothetical protein